MKNKAYLLLLLTLFFISCGSATQNGEGSITLDAGKVARYMCRNAADASALHSVYSRSGITYVSSDFSDINSFMYYDMNIKVSSIGRYETSSEISYKKSISEVFAADNIEATLESFYKEAAGKPITLEGIPVGSKIKVKIELSFGQSLDVDAYKQTLPTESLSLINEKLEQIQHQLTATRYKVEATSDTFTVKSGENTVTIMLSSPDGFAASMDIILFSNVNSRSDNALYSYPMGFTTNSFSTKIGLKLKDFGTDKLLDYACDSKGNLYYITANASNESHVLHCYGPDANWNEEIVNNSYNASGDTRIAIDEQSGEVFYGTNYENYFYVNTLPKYEDDDLMDDYSNDFSLTSIVSDYAAVLDFAVSLGTPVISTTADSSTVTYNDAIVYVAVLKSFDTGMNGPYNKDIVFIKKPMTYSVTQTSGSEKTVNILLRQSTPVVVNLSDTVPENYFLYNDFFGLAFSITDMTIHNGNLYALLSLVDNDGIYDDSLPDAYNYPIYSYGALIKINLSNFSNTGFSVIGYNKNNYTTFEHIQASDGLIDFYAYQPANVSAPYFFGPQKFVAIKPKELVIADDGYFYYTDGSDFCYKNVDRLVVFNEDTSELKAYLLDSSNLIKFNNYSDSDIELEVLGTGGSHKTPQVIAQCEYRP